MNQLKISEDCHQVNFLYKTMTSQNTFHKYVGQNYKNKNEGIKITVEKGGRLTIGDIGLVKITASLTKWVFLLWTK